MKCLTSAAGKYQEVVKRQDSNREPTVSVALTHSSQELPALSPLCAFKQRSICLVRF